MTSISIADEKRALRRRMRALRLVADQKQGPDAALALIGQLLPRLGDLALPAGGVVAGYWPIITEIDCRPVLARLADRGYTLALPVIAGAAAPLAFRRWRPEDDLDAGPHGTAQPRPSAPLVRPDLVLVPLLAFDDDGYRLGQGGGYYDRTLEALRRSGPLIAVGVAYAAQRVPRLPRAAGDQRLDWVLTEQALLRCAS